MVPTDELLDIAENLSDEKRGMLLTFARFLVSEDSQTSEDATLEIEQDPAMMKTLEASQQEIAAGKTVSWESIR